MQHIRLHRQGIRKKMQIKNKRIIAGIMCGLFSLLIYTPVQAADEYDLVIYAINTDTELFAEWLSAAEQACGITIGYVAAPTDSDTRQQKFTTVLSTGDSSIDVLFANDEMITTVKDTGWVVDLRDTVMTEELLPYFPQTYIRDMITSADGEIVALPSYKGAFSLWVNQKILDLVEMDTIGDLADFEEFCIRCKEKGIYGYGGSWERTYAFNEVMQFVNMFGGDYLDWTRPENRQALEFMKKMVDQGWTPIDQVADKYEQQDQKFIDGKYGMVFNWGTGIDFEKAGMLGEDAIHMIDIPLFEKKTVLTDSWCYVLNAASEHQDAAIRFLQWEASPEGEAYEYRCFGRYPARSDVAGDLIAEDDMVRRMYTNYDENYEIRGRAMLPQTMDFISSIGTLFQKYIFGVISVEEFCEEAQNAVEENR